MGQRINIQYSVDMDDLYKEVERMLSGACGDLVSVAGVSSDTFDFCHFDNSGLTLEAIKSVDVLRRELAKIDFILRDASMIISGYVTYKANEDTREPDALPEGEPVEEINEVAP